RPNIRFQQKRSLPADFRRTDGVPIHYQRDEQGKEIFKPKVRNSGKKREFGFDKLSSRENPLVLFTLLSQFVVGAFVLLMLLPQLSSAGAALSSAAHPLAWTGTLFGLIALQALALLSSASHLGKTRYFYRGFNNLRHSWLSREAAALSVFFGLLGAYVLVTTFPVIASWLPEPLAAALPTMTSAGAVIFGLFAIYCMTRIYRIKARPFWNHWHTGGAFFATLLILGSLALGLVFGTAEWLSGNSAADLLHLLSWPLLAGLLLQGVALAVHLRYLERRGAEADVSRVQMLTTYGKTYSARWISFGVLFGVALLLTVWTPPDGWLLIAWATLFCLALAHEIVGRALFYVLVTPTTMPGAFFWNNKYFEAHARKTGLANMPQVGVVPDAH
ncbi:MAG: dimethyl sulfoxide reductase anchor subunit, partial [Gammaproteobacteria bacterium]|nr:dimethyl sulfoxide reductase anchor subunit [Gammaproteobacteria bacterium]